MDRAGAAARRAAPAAALTVAGSDSGGGAGVQADLKTFTALGVFGGAVVTALTAQDTRGVRGVHVAPAGFVSLQLDAVLGDIGFGAVKTGMLPTAAAVHAVARALRAHGAPRPVVDPVMVASSGDALAGGASWLAALKAELVPLAAVVTPNLAEAARLVGRALRTERDVRAACREIHALGCQYVLVKGGHAAPGDPDGLAEDVAADAVATDILFDGERFHAFARPRLPGAPSHGTGCTLAAAIAAHMAKGSTVPEAVRAAKDYVFHAIRTGFAIGQGSGVLNHMHGIIGDDPES